MKGNIFLILLLMLVFTGCFRQEKTPPARSFPVTVGKVFEKEVPIYIDEIGNVFSFSTINVKPQVSGVILEAHVVQGQEVKKGDLLFTIDPRKYQAELEKAKGTLQKDIASLEFAQKRVERYAGLVEKDYVAKLTYEEYQSNVEGIKGQIAVDEGEVELAKINLEYCYIESPIDGKISEYNVYPGNFVRPEDTTPLTVIRQINPVDIHFTITQSNFDTLEQSSKILGRDFEVYLPDLKDKILKGKIYFVDNKIDLTTGTILLKGEINNDERLLWPGQFVRIRLLVTTENKALLVPFNAIEMGQKGNYLYVVKKDNTVDLRQVKTGAKLDDLIVVQKGVEPGETVVTDGQLNLRPGASVTYKKETEKETEKEKGKP